jgi:RNA ligase (TIGR02306 family)
MYTISTHRVEIVPVTLERHPNADSLSIVRIKDFVCVVRTIDWEGIGIGAYVQPDSIVDSSRPEFEFLKGHERVKVRRFRGVYSQGVLVTAPPGMKVGDDVAEIMGVTHYEPPEPLAGTACDTAPAPKGICYPVYGVESFRKYGREAFQSGEPVHVSEKLHGASARFMFDEDGFHVGSHRQWKKLSDNNPWWQAFQRYPGIVKYLQDHPRFCIYAELYGWVQDLRYGARSGDFRLAAFDIFDPAVGFLPVSAWREAEGVPFVPTVKECAFDADQILALADGPTLISGAEHCREGIVVRPLIDRYRSDCGRVILKVVSDAYLERA